MSEHTPGPWSIGVGKASGHKITIVKSGPQTIAALGGPGGFYANYEPNARLIAAAPELLAALKQLTAAAEKEDWDGHADAGSDPDLDVARAAIAKAEGQQP